ncbi:hypothetical protein [Profundibacter sp.]
MYNIFKEINRDQNDVAHLANRETADEYRRVVFRAGRYRVIECRHGIQWILQKRRNRKSPRGVAWEALGYCQTRKALDRLCRANIGSTTQHYAQLPERFATRNNGSIQQHG